MHVRSNDFLYMAMAVALSALGVLAVSNPNMQIGLYMLAGLMAVILAIAIILRPYLGAYVLIMAVFTNVSDLLTKQGQTGIMKPLVLLVAVAILIHYTDARQLPVGRFRTARVELFLFLYFLVVAASYIVAWDKDRALNQILDLAKDIVIVYCVQFALRNQTEWKQAFWIMMSVTAVLCSLQVYQTITGNYEQTFWKLASVHVEQVFSGSSTPRLGGPINEPNLWGQVLVSVLPFAIYRFIYEKSKALKLVALLFSSLMLFVIFNTYSRGAYLALAVVLILLLFELRVSSLLAFAGAVILIVGILLLPAEYRDRFATLAALSPTTENGIYQDSSFRGRSSEMLTGLEMFTRHPLLGVGAANYRPRYQEFAQLIGIETRSESRDAHSLYIQILAETGLLGIVLFLAFLLALWIALTQARQSVKGDPAFVSWLPWLSASRISILAYLTTSTFLHGAYMRFFWILVAMAITAIQLTQQQQLINAVSRRQKLGPPPS